MESVADADMPEMGEPEESSGELAAVPLFQIIALVGKDGVAAGLDLQWANGVTDPGFAARVLEDVRLQISSVTRSAEWLSRLLPPQDVLAT